jgi:hypothetical protein
MEPEGSLPHQQELSSCPYPEQGQLSQYRHQDGLVVCRNLTSTSESRWGSGLVGWRVSETATGVSCCELLMWEGGSWDWGEEGEHPPLEAVNKQRQWGRDWTVMRECV